MMENALRTLIQDSSRKYSHFLFNASKYQVAVFDTDEVKVVAVESELSKDFESKHEEKVSQTD